MSKPTRNGGSSRGDAHGGGVGALLLHCRELALATFERLCDGHGLAVRADVLRIGVRLAVVHADAQRRQLRLKRRLLAARRRGLRRLAALQGAPSKQTQGSLDRRVTGIGKARLVWRVR